MNFPSFASLATAGLLTLGATSALAGCPHHDAANKSAACDHGAKTAEPFACPHAAAAAAAAMAAKAAKAAGKVATPGFGAKMRLNDGKKWTVDAHTKNAGAQLRATITAAKMNKVEAAHGVAKKLNADLRGLIQGCTMKGPDHDMLHVFLSEFMPAVNKLSKAGNMEEAKGYFTTVQQGVDAFEAHFE